MKKEYLVQMFRDGEWKHAMWTTGIPWRKGRPVEDRRIAENGIDRLKQEWAENKLNRPNAPIAFRIVSREVSEWSVDE